MENGYKDTTNLNNDQQTPEMNSGNEFDRDNFRDNQHFILNHDGRYRDDGIFV